MISWKILALLFIALAYHVVDMSVQGKFSSPAVSNTKPVREVYVIPEKTKQELVYQQSENLQKESVNNQLKARVSELELQIKEALETIGKLTSDLQKCQGENDSLRRQLKEALENISFMKKQLGMCESKLNHQYLKNQYCNMKQMPNLLR